MGILYRYIFRGFGVLMLIGIITILILAVTSQTRHTAPNDRRSSVSASR